jgi:hypothetical protein
MNSGLPSLLDAIFGKNDLVSVSLDEMYEVVNEFPSFNAAHFLLAKKLKEQNDAAFEKQSMRTALYFNNAFWLQTLLDEGNKRVEVSAVPVRTQDEDTVNIQETHITESFEPAGDAPDEEISEPAYPETNESPNHTDTFLQNTEPAAGTVSSFDELLSKYKIELETLEEEELNRGIAEIINEETAEAGDSVGVAFQSPEPAPEFQSEFPVEQDKELNSFNSDKNISESRVDSASDEFTPGTNSDLFETRVEVLNEYGIFEDVIVQKSTHEVEVFVRPVDQDPGGAVDKIEEALPASNDSPVEIQTQNDSSEKPDVHEYESFDRPLIGARREDGPYEDELDEEISEVLDEKISEVPDEEIGEVLDEKISEVPDEEISEVLDEKINEVPDEEISEVLDEKISEVLDEKISEVLDEKTAESPKLSDNMVHQNADNTELTIPFTGESEEDLNGRMQDLTERFNEHQKSVPVFDPKKAESIVFAPYHMIDYFASQGIKLVLEENPPDHFGQQLKTFTDWLKVMKKLPAQQLSGKTDEREADRIRHFAAHSIEERDVLTESMAEVLAKQGMYENAIALYQKLSLIYPPKSAYFASRIEQLKASLP